MAFGSVRNAAYRLLGIYVGLFAAPRARNVKAWGSNYEIIVFPEDERTNTSFTLEMTIC